MTAQELKDAYLAANHEDGYILSRKKPVKYGSTASFFFDEEFNYHGDYK